MLILIFVFFFKQKTAYEMRISDWSSDVCSSDLHPRLGRRYLLRNHQKVAIADASRAIIGGFNVEDEYFMPDHPESWHDYGVEVEGPSIAHLARSEERRVGTVCVSTCRSRW